MVGGRTSKNRRIRSTVGCLCSTTYAYVENILHSTYACRLSPVHRSRAKTGSRFCLDRKSRSDRWGSGLGPQPYQRASKDVPRSTHGVLLLTQYTTYSPLHQRTRRECEFKDPPSCFYVVYSSRLLVTPCFPLHGGLLPSS